MGLMARFALAMTLALTVVAVIAGAVLFRTSSSISNNVRRRVLDAAGAGVVVLGHVDPRYQIQGDDPREHPNNVESFPVFYYDANGKVIGGQYFRRTPETAAPIELIVPHEKRVNARGREDGFKMLEEPSDKDLKTRFVEAMSLTARDVDHRSVGNWAEEPYGVESRVVAWDVTHARDGRLETEERRGTLFRATPETGPIEWIVPEVADESKGLLLRIILVVMALVVLVGAGVAMWVGRQVVGPINDVVDDIRQISKGDLRHRTNARGGGEIELLARSIDRMTRELLDAQGAELELGIREREMELATGVREALLPVTTPLVEGYDVGAAHIPGQLGGDFHEYLELGDGRIGLLCCDVSGHGVPAALIGATARAFLRSALSEGGDVGEAFRSVNRDLARDVRRGMYVTALYVLLDPKSARVQVACAGHKVPLLRYSASDETLRLVHPEGIALGFDNGPVFDRRLELQEVDLAVGDRLLLANSGPILIRNPEGAELGEKAFYSSVLRYAALPTPKFLRGIRKALSDYAGEAGSNVDVSLVTVTREA